MRRIQRDAAVRLEHDRRAILRDFIEVMDDLDRALESDARANDAMTCGVEIVRDTFLAKLRAHGAERSASLDEVFDPSRHEAVCVVPTSSAEHNMRIVEVIQHGYTIGEEVLRPARVIVAKHAA